MIFFLKVGLTFVKKPSFFEPQQLPWKVNELKKLHTITKVYSEILEALNRLE